MPAAVEAKPGTRRRAGKKAQKNKPRLHVRPAPEISLVRALRVVRGWSQQTLAIRAGVSQFSVSRIERRTRIPTAQRKAMLADALGVEPSDIFLAEKAEASRARRG